MQTEQEEVPNPNAGLAFAVDAMLSQEKGRVRSQVRQSHLKRNGVEDPMTKKVLAIQQRAEAELDDLVAEQLKMHVAYPWFSRIRGLGMENVAKVVGMLNITKAQFISSFWKYAGMHVVNVEVGPEQQLEEIRLSYEALGKKLDQLEKKFTGNPDAISPLTPTDLTLIVGQLGVKMEQSLEPVIRGYAPRPVPGEKLGYNKELRTMCFRMAGTILKAGIRYFCTQCDTQRPPIKDGEDPVCTQCGGTEFNPKPISKYAEYYMKEKKKLFEKYRNRGILVVPTSELPKKNGKIFEPIGMISEGHLHMQAQRKMIKLFLSHLWQVWAEAIGREPSKPWVFSIAGHDPISYIGPWEMIDKPKAS